MTDSDKWGIDMKCSFPNIEKEMKLRNLSCGDLAKIIGLTDLQMYRRLSGAVQWKLEEAYLLCKVFNRYDIQALFEKKSQTTVNVGTSAKYIKTGEDVSCVKSAT
jgi:hypothetical protein